MTSQSVDNLELQISVQAANSNANSLIWGVLECVGQGFLNNPVGSKANLGHGRIYAEIDLKTRATRILDQRLQVGSWDIQRTERA
jgi:hypothetical protein